VKKPALAGTAAVAGLVAAGFIVAGCSAGSSSSSAATSAANSAATASYPGQAESHMPSGPASHPAPAAGSPTCLSGELSFTLGTATGTAAQRTQVIDVTNKGSSKCSLDGFPGVDLHGTANGSKDYTWSLARQSAAYSAVTLQPGGTGHFSLVYLPGASGDTNMTVAKLVITPPNGYVQAQVTWAHSVVLQDGATHPGTYITPVVSGS
jgi:hypothetical protein